MPNGVPTTWMVTLYAHPPVVVDRGSGGSFIDIDGNTYVDFNLADTSMFTGYGVQAIARAVGEQWSRVRSSCCPQRLRTRSRWN
jgi:glutamate-1-semialdehyde 2,1-aminomutase